MGVNVKAVLGSVAVCGVLLLAGCGGSEGAAPASSAASGAGTMGKGFEVPEDDAAEAEAEADAAADADARADTASDADPAEPAARPAAADPKILTEDVAKIVAAEVPKIVAAEVAKIVAAEVPKPAGTPRISQISYDAPSNQFFTLKCPSGQLAISGGYYIGDRPDRVLVANHLDTPDTWRFYMKDTTGAGGPFKAFVLCLAA